MTTITEIQNAIEELPKEDFSKLRQWFSEKDWDLWDRQIEEDSNSGKLDVLMEEARQDFKHGNTKLL